MFLTVQGNRDSKRSPTLKREQTPRRVIPKAKRARAARPEVMQEMREEKGASLRRSKKSKMARIRKSSQPRRMRTRTELMVREKKATGPAKMLRWSENR